MADLKPILLVVVIVLVLATGTTGYMNIEGWSLLESLYMTSLTVTTVGFQEVHPLSDTGRLFTIGLMFVGIGIVIYGITVFSNVMMEPLIRRLNHHKNIPPGLIAEEGEVSDLLQIAGKKDDLEIYQFKVKKVSKFANKKKGEILQDQGMLVMGIRQKNGNFSTDVSFHHEVKVGDDILVMGTEKQLKRLR